MAKPLLSTRDLCKRFGAVVATDSLSLDIRTGEIHAVIGPNGAGKTTLLSQLAGQLRPDSGSIRFKGTDITPLPAHRRTQLGLTRSFQITSVFGEFTTADNVALALQGRQGHSFRFLWSARRDPRLREPAKKLLETLGLGARMNTPAAALSHGEARQLEIAMVLATRPSMLLLDEPMAGMGMEETTRMAALLSALKGPHTMLLVEHDMDVVFRLADRITVLVYGRAIATGTPEEIRADREVRTAYLGSVD